MNVSSRPARLIDLGCGAGRHAIRFAGRGFDVVAVDLSGPCSRPSTARRTCAGTSRCSPLQANVCRLGCFPADTFDYALSMFSTLGMIRGRPARRRALSEAFRILRPGGRLALHVHNLWLNLRDPQGRMWLLGQFSRALLSRDRVRRPPHDLPRHPRHGGPPLPLGRAQARASCRRVCRSTRSIPLEDVTYQPISHPWLLHRFRAGGWMIFARKPG